LTRFLFVQVVEMINKKGIEMQDLHEIINNKVQAMVDDKVIQKAVENGVAKAIETAIANQFERFGGVTSQIEKTIKEGLQVDLKDLPFETYNAQMLVLIKSKLGNMFQGAAADRFLSEMDRILAPVPKEMPIHEFVETVVGFWKTDEPWDADDMDDYATVEVEPYRDDPNSKDITLKFWKQKERNDFLSSRKKENPPTMQLFILDGRIRINHKHEYNPTCFSETEALVFKMYAAGTVLTGIEGFDQDNCDLTLKDEY